MFLYVFVEMVVVLPISLVISVSLLVPLIVGKVWQCKESERMVEGSSRQGGKTVLPGVHKRKLGVL